ncbi:MAG TPA: hypothetical protein VMW75_07405 [Thermoanaerobaculia bacterium]|nr:hypothetical protein [Thermoanaerobaculia bacterium]
MTLHPKLDRVQTSVRMERRLVKVLKAIAELRDVSLGALLEGLVFDAFAGRSPFDEGAMVQVRELMRIYGLSPAAPAAPAQEGE